MVPKRSLSLIMCLVCTASVAADSRTWTDSGGKFHTEAELVDYQNGHAYLKEDDGRIVSVLASRLSASDREFVKASAPAVQVITGKVVGITDGDTLTVLDKTNKQYKVRLEGIDAPESHQAYGSLARKALSERAFQKNVVVESHGRDKYGRTLGHIFADGHWINNDLVRDGWAWHYREYSKSEVLAGAESEARTKHAGLWQDENPIAPWDFRHSPATASTKAQPPASAPKDEPASKSGNKQVVYVTKTGTKYHQAGCRSLSKSQIPMVLADATERYSPCSICHPPTIANDKSSSPSTAKSSINQTTSSPLAATGVAPANTSSTDRNPNGETVTGQTATGIPTYTGPRGGHYHYSKNGNKVYDRKK